MAKLRGLPDRDGTFTRQTVMRRGNTPPTPTPTAKPPTFGSGGWIGQQLKHWWDEHSGFNIKRKTNTPKITPTRTPRP
jgi:hypothetical protein